MHASPGGSVVAQSLLRQAADRGVTICFADLDGADGLWVPEERTVLVNRGLSEAKVAEVIEHELAHVMIDDQHAELDAGKDVLVGQPQSGRRREAVALTAALGLVAVVGGVMYGLHTARGPENRVAPNPNAPGLTATESGSPRPSLSPSPGRNGVVSAPVNPTAPSGSGLGPPISPPGISPTATKPLPKPTATDPSGHAPSGPGPSSSPPPPSTPTPDPPASTTPPPDPTTPAPTTPVQDSAGAGDTGGQGGGTDSGTLSGIDGGALGTDPPAAADASAAVPVGDTGAP